MSLQRPLPSSCGRGLTCQRFQGRPLESSSRCRRGGPRAVRSYGGRSARSRIWGACEPAGQTEVGSTSPERGKCQGQHGQKAEEKGSQGKKEERETEAGRGGAGQRKTEKCFKRETRTKPREGQGPRRGTGTTGKAWVSPDSWPWGIPSVHHPLSPLNWRPWPGPSPPTWPGEPVSKSQPPPHPGPLRLTVLPDMAGKWCSSDGGRESLGDLK